MNDVFFTEFVTLEHGETIEMPIFSLALENRVRQKISHAFDSLPEDQQLEIVSNFFTFKSFRVLIAGAPEILSSVGSEVFGKPAEWVNENVTAAEVIQQTLVRIAPKKSDADESDHASSDWSFAQMVEFLQHEYKWTSAQVLEHSRDQIKALMEACTERYEAQNRAVSDGSPRKRSRSKRRSDLGEDGGLSSLESFAAHNNLVIKESGS